MHPMARGCYKGELNVCKWLYDNGAAEDITKANNSGFTPMYFACKGGHLLVCQWLFEVGAAEDITKANIDGDTPMNKWLRSPSAAVASRGNPGRPCLNCGVGI